MSTNEPLERSEMELFLRTRVPDSDFISFAYIHNYYKDPGRKKRVASITYSVEELNEKINYYTSGGMFGIVILSEESNYCNDYTIPEKKREEYDLGHSSIVLVLPQIEDGVAPELLLIDQSTNVQHTGYEASTDNFGFMLGRARTKEITFNSRNEDPVIGFLQGKLSNHIKYVRFQKKDGTYIDPVAEESVQKQEDNCTHCVLFIADAIIYRIKQEAIEQGQVITKNNINELAKNALGKFLIKDEQNNYFLSSEFLLDIEKTSHIVNPKGLAEQTFQLDLIDMNRREQGISITGGKIPVGGLKAKRRIKQHKIELENTPKKTGEKIKSPEEEIIKKKTLEKWKEIFNSKREIKEKTESQPNVKKTKESLRFPS